MILDLIRNMFERAATDRPCFPPTTLFNETWMIRLVLEAYAELPVEQNGAAITFHSNAAWFSEAQLPSAFLPRHRGDVLAEGWTHADGVVTQLPENFNGRGGLYLSADATQLAVFEAKMFSSLSAGTTRASRFRSGRTQRGVHGRTTASGRPQSRSTG